MIIHSLLFPKSATVIIDICTRQFHILHRNLELAFHIENSLGASGATKLQF